jgi:hypothetical protein
MKDLEPARISVTDYLRPNTDWRFSGYNHNGAISGPEKHGFDEVRSRLSRNRDC